jgi:hypothetical protein
VVAAAVQLHKEVRLRVRTVDPTPELPPVAGGKLTSWLGESGMCDEVDEARLELARRSHVPRSARLEELSHECDASATLRRQVLRGGGQERTRHGPAGQAVVDRTLDASGMEDRGEVDERPGDTGRGNAIHDGEMLGREYSRPVDDGIAAPVPAGPRCRHLREPTP